MITICKTFEFAAAHHLPYHKGKCKNLHGHNYSLEVEISGPINQEGSEKGMICDFGILKTVVTAHILEKVDHRNLNDHWQNPTAENMVIDMAKVLEQYFSGFDITLERLRLWETSNSYAEWRK
jgi:6-pyruvoyltetrahydropterin/6-carboxytetrahydropterin synthase